MTPKEEGQQEKIHELLGEFAAEGDVEHGAVLVRWAVVMDWMGPDGARSLTRLKSDGCTDWEMRGLFHAGMDDMDWESS